MGARSTAREAALQMLYALDVQLGKEPVDIEKYLERFDLAALVDNYWAEVPGDPEDREFADRLVHEVRATHLAIDKQIASASRHWRIERMAVVDRNILRLGTCELGSAAAPRAVVIDEAVELAKRFGSQGSSVFVNGVLDRVAEDLKAS